MRTETTEIEITGTVNDGSAAEIAEALRENTVEVLDLERITMSVEGFVLIFNALGENTSLKSLNLKYAKIITEDAATALGEALRINTALETLSYGNNGANVSLGEQILAALEENFSLLEVNDCSWGKNVNIDQINYQINEKLERNNEFIEYGKKVSFFVLYNYLGPEYFAYLKPENYWIKGIEGDDVYEVMLPMRPEEMSEARADEIISNAQNSSNLESLAMAYKKVREDAKAVEAAWEERVELAKFSLIDGNLAVEEFKEVLSGAIGKGNDLIVGDFLLLAYQFQETLAFLDNIDELVSSTLVSLRNVDSEEKPKYSAILKLFIVRSEIDIAAKFKSSNLEDDVKKLIVQEFEEDIVKFCETKKEGKREHYLNIEGEEECIKAFENFFTSAWGSDRKKFLNFVREDFRKSIKVEEPSQIIGKGKGDIDGESEYSYDDEYTYTYEYSGEDVISNAMDASWSSLFSSSDDQSSKGSLER